jgi:oligoribonuclease
MDKMFLMQAPWTDVIDHLHYRVLDVSAIKEAAKRWCAAEVVAGVPGKKGGHRARDDILESIEEARYYMENIFTPAEKAREE